MTVMAEDISPPTSSFHPRRRPAKESVSLVHRGIDSPPAGNRTDSSSMHVDASSDVLTKPIAHRQSSGESSSNAERWFINSNLNLKSATKIADDDPPFLLRNSSSAHTLPDQATRELLHEVTSSGSASEEYRSVIDDLTVENKKLKMRLRKYERSQNPKLTNEAL